MLGVRQLPEWQCSIDAQQGALCPGRNLPGKLPTSVETEEGNGPVQRRARLRHGRQQMRTDGSRVGAASEQETRQRADEGERRTALHIEQSTSKLTNTIH